MCMGYHLLQELLLPLHLTLTPIKNTNCFLHFLYSLTFKPFVNYSVEFLPNKKNKRKDDENSHETQTKKERNLIVMFICYNDTPSQTFSMSKN